MTSAQPTRIFLVDDHAVLLDGLIAALTLFPSIKVVGKAASAEEALPLIRAMRDDIDVVVTDHSMAEMDGVTMCETLKREHQKPKVVLLTAHSVPEVAFKASRKGVDRVLLKSTSIDKLVDNILETVHQIEAIVLPSPGFETSVTENLGLTKTELMILMMIADEELTTREIAEKLFRSVHTIERHRKSIMLKLGVHNTAGLVNFAHQLKSNDT